MPLSLCAASLTRIALKHTHLVVSAAAALPLAKDVTWIVNLLACMRPSPGIMHPSGAPHGVYNGYYSPPTHTPAGPAIAASAASCVAAACASLLAGGRYDCTRRWRVCAASTVKMCGMDHHALLLLLEGVRCSKQ